MERWVPLFQIFLDSSCPEGEASTWLQHHPTSAFLSLLLSPAHISPNPTKCVWLQTLPYVMQSRILSFLAVESCRFPSEMLRSLATHVVLDSIGNGKSEAQLGEEVFWVRRAARHLLDVIPDRSPGVLVEHHDEGVEQEFGSLPDWLRTVAETGRPVLPWLPLCRDDINRKSEIGTNVDSVRDMELEENVDSVEDVEEEIMGTQVELSGSGACTSPLSTQIYERAIGLKSEIQAIAAPSDAIRVSRDIQELCVDAGGGSVGENLAMVLGHLEAWEADDEIAPVLLSNLLACEVGYSKWPVCVFSALILPKLIFLQHPASRVILSCTIDFCKIHQKHVVSGLLFPLVYRKDGINPPLCDVIVRVMKECMHPSQVSAFCQRLLCGQRIQTDFACLPCHANMISIDLVWSESLFSLIQHLLAWGVPMTPDTIDVLVFVTEDVCCKLSKSLKFGSFLLNLVTKSDHALKFHKIRLMRVAEKTETFLTKSIISKLNQNGN